MHRPLKHETYVVGRKCPVTRRVYGRSAARTRILAEEIRPEAAPASRIRLLEEERSLSLSLSLSFCFRLCKRLCLRLFIARGVVCERTKISEGIFFALSLRKPSYIWTATRRARYKSCVALSLSLSLSLSLTLERSRRRVEIKHSPEHQRRLPDRSDSGTEVPGSSTIHAVARMLQLTERGSAS